MPADGPPHSDCSDEMGPLVLAGLSGQLVMSHLSNADLRSCSESSRHLRSLASESVSALAPRLAHSLERLAERFPSITSLDLANGVMHEGQASAGLSVGGLRTVLMETSSLPLLKHLRLPKCVGLCDSLLTQLPLPGSIEHIEFHASSKLTWAGLGRLSSLPNLRRLNCSGIKYTGLDACTDSAGLTQMLGRLNSLTMGDACSLSWVDDNLMNVIGRDASQLTTLDCGGCIDMTDRGVSQIRGLTKLQSLSLQSCVRLTNGSLASVAELCNLRQLNIRGCLQINDAGLKQLCSLTLLEKLGLSCCLGIQSLGDGLFARMKGLRSLSVANCTSLDSLAQVSVLASSLEELNISSCSKLTLASLEALSSLTSLTSLDMSSFSNQVKVQVSPEGGRQPELQRLSRLTNLQVLRLSRFRHPQGLPTGLLRAIAGMTGLQELHMASCTPEQVQPSAPGSTPDGFSAAAAADGGSSSRSQLWFLSRLTDLRSLDLSGWRHATPESLRSLAGLSQLTQLKLQRYGNDTAAARLASSEQHRALAPIRCPRPASPIPSVPGAVPSHSGCAPASPKSSGSVQSSCLISVKHPMASSQQLTVAEEDADAQQSSSSSSSSSSSCPGLSEVELKMAAVNIHGSSSSSSSSCLADALANGAVLSSSCCGERREPCDSCCCSVDSQPGANRESLPLCGLAAAGGTQCPLLLPPSPASSQPQPQLQLQPDGSHGPHDGMSLEQGLACLENMPKLESLDLEACLSLDDDSLYRIAHLSSLKQLNLAGCKRLTGSSLGALGSAAGSGLQEGATSTTSAAGCSQMEELCLDDCPAISDHALSCIAQLGALCKLSLRGCTLVGDAGLAAISTRLHRLTHLSLYGAANVTSKGVESLVRLPNLKSLQLPHCWNIDDEGMRALMRCSTLMSLSVSHCWRLSHSAIQELMRAKPMLTVVHSQLKSDAC